MCVCVCMRQKRRQPQKVRFFTQSLLATVLQIFGHGLNISIFLFIFIHHLSIVFGGGSSSDGYVNWVLIYDSFVSEHFFVYFLWKEWNYTQMRATEKRSARVTQRLCFDRKISRWKSKWIYRHECTLVWVRSPPIVCKTFRSWACAVTSMDKVNIQINKTGYKC